MVLEQLQRALTQVELDAIMAHKGRDDDRVFYIHSNCHSDSPTWTRYESEGFLRVECSECLKTIVIVKVAEA
jgi:peptide subunit release factor 1 (eRF1)